MSPKNDIIYICWELMPHDQQPQQRLGLLAPRPRAARQILAPNRASWRRKIFQGHLAPYFMAIRGAKWP